ncbi:hypothetical protein [Xenorhabdus bovienii]|uniref:hypothetical protein n=1 Tax=Xenorhabdus bovienii TaxID=40576 RepID=UPI003DA4AD0D
MEQISAQWLFIANPPYCLQINRPPQAEPVPVQLDWRPVRKKLSRLSLLVGRECRWLGDGDFTVFRLTTAQWQAVVEGNAEVHPEQWEPMPFTLSELAVHPEFAIFTTVGMTEAGKCEN